ncbi:ADP-ribosylation factor-binding protein GGA3 isoform X3 [Mus pahari]|nr:ADP-ribosylation factor-binding protein GGA3 isoform X3 [Mus pahari]
MLKRQGIVQSDPPIPMDRTLIPSPPPRPKNPVFDDEEKSKLLARLLKSKNPDDLQEANRLIKSMVKEDEARIQKVTKRLHTLEEVNNNVKLLHEMLLHYSQEYSSEADKELMKELFDRCENKRRTLFKLASETEDNDNGLGDILQASDNLSRVINSYKTIIEGQIINGEVTTSTMPDSEGNSHCSNQGTLIDLAELDIPSSSSPALAPPTSGIPILPPPPQTSGPPRSRSSSQAEAPPGPDSADSTSNALCLLDEELLCLGLTDPAPTAPKESPGSNQWHLLQNEPSSDLDFFTPRLVPTASCPSDGPQIPPSVSTSSMSQAPLPAAFPAPVVPAIAPTHSTGSFMFSSGPVPALVPKAEPKGPEYPSSSTSNRLDALDQLLEEAKVTSGLVRPVSCFSPGPTASPLLPASAPARPLLPFSTGPGSPLFQSQGSPQKGPELSLASVHVPLESIKPSSALPVTAYDKNGFRILFHFAKECPPGRPDVLVVVVSMLNTAPLPVKSIVLQAAVPKSMKVKLQPPSGTELSPFSPLQPPAAITQVMLLANPMKEKVRLRYKLTFALGEQLSTELGEVDQFPPVEQWGNL